MILPLKHDIQKKKALQVLHFDMITVFYMSDGNLSHKPDKAWKSLQPICGLKLCYHSKLHGMTRSWEW